MKHLFTQRLVQKYAECKNWTQQNVSTKEQINWYNHTMKYYSATNKKIINVHATTWMNLKNIILNAKSFIQKSPYYMVPFI